MSFRIHQAPDVNLNAQVQIQSAPVKPSAPQIDVAALQAQLIALQSQVSQLQAAAIKPAPTPMRINVAPTLQPSAAPISGLQLPQNEVVLLSRSPCPSPRGSPRR